MKQKSHSEMEKVLASYSNYEGTKKAFCEEYRIKLHTFYYWQRKLRGGSSPNKEFIKLELTTDEEIGTIQIDYPNGNRLSLPSTSSVALLQALVKTSV